MRGRLLLACSLVSMALVSLTAWSTSPIWSAKQESVEVKAFSRPEMHVTGANLPLADVLSLLPNTRQWNEFLQERGPQTAVYIDPRSGAASGIQLTEPLIPGNGKRNRVSLEDLERALGKNVTEVTPEIVGQLVTQFLGKNRGVMGLDLDQLGPAHAVKISDELWDVSLPQVVRGVPVRFARVVATLSHGNLVLIGAEVWGNVSIDTHPSVTPDEALKAGFDQAGGRRAEDTLWKEPSLEILPVTPSGRETPYVRGRRPGDGYAHWLVWSFGFKRGEEPANWEVLVDAHSGEVVAIQDTNYEELRRIKGTIYPMTNTGACPSPDRCGVVQPGTPMSFADYLNQNTYSNSAGLFDFTGTATSTLTSPYVQVTSACGTISASSTSGDIDFGGGGNQHDCTTPGGGYSAGDTSAARTAAYELNKIAEMGRGWLPNNPWLQGALGPQQIKVDRTALYVCVAAYDPVGGMISAGRGGLIINGTCCQSPECSQCDPGTCGVSCCTQCSHQCRNMGEIATIIDHEWGHALDNHDGSNSMSTTSEAYADITAAYRTQTSCSGYGFKTTWPTDAEGCTLTSDGTGYNGNLADVGAPHCLTDCSGKRDSDYLKHVDMTPDTPQNFVCSSCGASTNGRPGPCGLEEHCEGAPITQAAWDLAARDLQSSPFNYSKTKAFNIANRLHFQGSSNVQIWHTCSCASGTSDGCGAGSGYLSWLAADDDDGDLNNGTPHMTAIFAAFNRHNIACSAPTPQNGGCSGAPTTAPTVTVTPGTNQVALSWTADPQASKYFVYRTEGQAGCDMGRALIGTPSTNSFTDTEVTDGRVYYYTVESVGASDACSGPTSACACAANPPLNVPDVCNGIDDNCNGQIDEGVDADGDGYSTCGGDCNDNNPSINPGATELCDGIDNNCNGQVDEGFDADGDGYTSCGGDCNDQAWYINPGMVEQCDNFDDNCDGRIDEGFDADGDGYTSCASPVADCNDASASIHPGATETCNNLDDNCNGTVDETFDQDFDHWTTCALPIPDCNDNDARINGVETSAVNTSCFDRLDNDCDGVVDWDCAMDVGAPTNEVVEYGAVSPAQPAALANMSAASLNNTYETITEVNTAGVRRLSVYWTFANPNYNNWWALRVEGYRATSGDSYTFSVAQRTQAGACGPNTGETYTTAFTVSKTVDDDLLQVFQIGPPNPGTLAFCVHVVDTITSSDKSSDSLKLDKMYLMPIILDAKADSETTAIGTHVNGTNWTQTLGADGAYEILQEGTGDALDHTWRFPSVPVGYSHTLHFQGFRTGSSGGDDFQFYYATPDPLNPSQPGPFQLITGAIVNTGLGGQNSDWTFGPQSTTAPLYGTVWIKVRDTVPGSPTLDKLETDYLAIRATP